MTTATAQAPATGRTGFLAGVNAVMPFLAAVLYSIPLFLTIDLVSAVVALGLSIALLLCAGVGPLTILRRSWALFIAAPLSGVSMLLYAEPEGHVHARVWLATISDGSIELAAAIALRVLAIGVPMLTMLFGIDETRLGDALAQVLRLPARFVLGALAGIRLFSVFRSDWEQLAAARRARGLGDHGRLARWFGMAFTLLVLAVRRAGRLATAMEARGFGDRPRTWARPSTLGWRDAVLVATSAAVALAAVGAAVATGSFRFPGT